jgi:(p)ppGpp synthase/HD superfamily hydrolase
MDKEMNNNKIAIFTKAVNFAAFKHRDQRRKNGDIPYINHPIEVANILASSGVTDV